MNVYVALKLSLQIVFVVVDDSLVGDGHEYLFSGLIGQIVDTIVDMVVESERPFEFQSTGFPKVFFIPVVFLSLHKLQNIFEIKYKKYESHHLKHFY